MQPGGAARHFSSVYHGIILNRGNWIQNTFGNSTVLSLLNITHDISREETQTLSNLVYELRNLHAWYLARTLQRVLNSPYNRIVTAPQVKHLMHILQLKINYRFTLKPHQRLLTYLRTTWLEINVKAMRDFLLVAYMTKQTPSRRNASLEILPLNFTISTQPHSYWSLWSPVPPRKYAASGQRN